MSSMSSAQIVSATTAMHSKSSSLNLGLTPPASYPGAAVSLATPEMTNTRALSFLLLFFNRFYAKDTFLSFLRQRRDMLSLFFLPN